MAETTSTGVTVADIKAYLRIDGDSDDTMLQNLIDAAESAAQNAISPSVPLSTYRTYPLFNQAVRVLIDFNYFNRGNLNGSQLAYPPSFQYMLNAIRFRITGGDQNGT